jgi:hypothetical protein
MMNANVERARCTRSDITALSTLQIHYFLAEDFFRRSAQRFFIISEMRFRPAAVIPPLRFGLAVLAKLGALWRAVPFEDVPSRALIAWLIRSRSTFSSVTIVAMLK